MRYENPTWPDYFADPFVLKTGDAYYAYGTGATAIEPDGRAFRMLRSTDLIHWQYLGGAVEAISGATAYWAPEVLEHEGKFYLYFSAALQQGDQYHRLRVAVADRPEGPFVDSGKKLLKTDEFAIDANPFHDPRSGEHFLYYALDRTSDQPYGTGIGVIQMKDPITPTGEPKMILRASADWQIYQRDRDYQGRIWKAWYTMEGPSVMFHDERYWCFYSGGCWSTADYGVGVAVADHPLGPWRDDWASQGPVVLKGVPDRVLGPGHNSVTLAPDNRSTMLIYHAWDRDLTMRRMCMDPLLWTPDGPRCDGPSFGPRVFGGVGPDGAQEPPGPPSPGRFGAIQT